jgi:hypothetical protein
MKREQTLGEMRVQWSNGVILSGGFLWNGGYLQPAPG